MKKRSKTAVALASFVACAMMADTAIATVTVFTDRTAFLAAAGGTPINETFDTPMTFSPGNNFYNGVNFLFPGTVGLNSISGGNFNGDEFTTTSLDIVYPVALSAWGADFVGAFTAQGLEFTIDDGTVISLNAALGMPGTGFVGFISTVPFSTIDFSSPEPPNEIYDMDNMVAIEVPGPGTAALLAIAAIGCVGRRRR